MRRFAMLFGPILAIILFGTVSAEDSVTVNLNPVNNSGIAGSAVFTPRGHQTEVVVTMVGEPAGASEPIHLHSGQCGATLGGVKYPLKNVENGTSTTVINAEFIPLWSGDFAINAHESAANIKNYVACGNLPAMATSATVMPKTGGVPIAPVVLIAGTLLGAGYALRRRAAQS